MKHAKLINEAIEYILLHINETVTAEDVAEHCHVSKYYFSRLFRQETGESIYAFIKKKKMEFSAFMLKSGKNKSITDIAGEYGYSSSNYSTAFKEYFHQSPAAFRCERFDKYHALFDAADEHVQKIYTEMDSLIRIKEMQPYSILYERHIGNYSEMKKQWHDFCLKYDAYQTDQTIYFERTFDDPSITDQNQCLFDICMSDEGIKDRTKLREPAVFGTINGGKFAVCSFKGYLSEIFLFHRKLIDIWLPLSGYVIDSRYSYDLYHTVQEDTYYMEFDVCLPIQ